LSWSVSNGDIPSSTTSANTTVTITQNTALVANAKDSEKP